MEMSTFPVSSHYSPLWSTGSQILQHLPSIALFLFTGFGGGRGGCLVPWEVGVRAEGEGWWVLVPAEDTDRTGLEVPAEGEEYWMVGWLDGVRGGPSMPGSAGELISHLGGITDCLGGRGSRRVSCSASWSGTKWLSDSANTEQQTGYM